MTTPGNSELSVGSAIPAEVIAQTEAQEVNWLLGKLSESYIDCEGEILDPAVQRGFETFLGFGNHDAADAEQAISYESFGLNRDVAFRAMQIVKEVSQNYLRHPDQPRELSAPASERRAHATLNHSGGDLIFAVFDWGPEDEEGFTAIRKRLAGPQSENEDDLALTIGAIGEDGPAMAQAALSTANSSPTLSNGRLSDAEALDALLEVLSPNGRGISLSREYSDQCGVNHIYGTEGNVVGMVQWYTFESTPQASARPLQPAA